MTLVDDSDFSSQKETQASDRSSSFKCDRTSIFYSLQEQ